jgi:hypothetical protein
MAIGERTDTDGVVHVEITEDALEASARYPRLHGEAENKLYTLDDCLASRTSWSVFGGVGSQVIHIGRILRGAIFDAGEALEATGITFSVTNLNYWLAETGITENWNFSDDGSPLDAGVPEFSLQGFAKPDRQVDISDDRTLMLQHSVGIEGDGIDKRSITQSFNWRLDSTNGKVPVDDALDWASDLQDLISICSGGPAAFKLVQLWHPDVGHHMPDGRIIPFAIDMFAQWNVGRERSTSRSGRPDFLFTFADFDGLEGVRRWMEVTAEHRTSLGRVTATRYAQSMFVSDRLLNCAAALEGLDRTITGNSNSRFKTRLSRCSTLAGQPFVRLVGDVTAWAEAVRLDRDDVAHHFGRRTRSSSIATLYLWESLYYLYVLCLMRLCNSPESVFTLIQQHAAYRRVAREIPSLI